MSKPYLIHSITGNSKLLACYDERGQLHRLFWPRIDHPQHVDQHFLGLFLQESNYTHWLQDPAWEASQQYVEDTIILQTRLVNRMLGMEIVLEDFAIPGEDLLVRQLQISNQLERERSGKLVLFSNMRIGDTKRYQTSYVDTEVGALVQYFRDYYFMFGSPTPVAAYQCASCFEGACVGSFGGNQQSTCADAAISFQLPTLAPNSVTEFSLFIALGTDREAAAQTLLNARARGATALRKLVEADCQSYLAAAKSLGHAPQQVTKLYRRSLLTIRLLTDAEDGGVIAAPEFDEDYTRSGGYGYCWGRDAAFITTAIDQAGLHQQAEAFYRWAAKAQSSSGRWEQRHYLNGMVGPTWGLQIDETGSILWGIADHYQRTKQQMFVERMWPTVYKGAQYLVNFLAADTGLPRASYDLWEERQGTHTYSAAAVYGGLVGSATVAEALGHRAEAEAWQAVAQKVAKAIQSLCWLPLEEHFARTVQVQSLTPIEIQADYQLDCSLLGLVLPFKVLTANDPRMMTTVSKMRDRLWNLPSGGLKRYDHDAYIGGNPWVLTTLWLGLYYLEAGQQQEAIACFNWVLDKANSVGLLPEQVDKHTGKPAWVIPLAWSHAMYVHLALALSEQGLV